MGAGYPKGRRRRAEIVEVAFAKFASVGYRNASMVRIAADCGVSRMGLAHHFPTKESLLAAVLEERDRVNGELFFAGFDATADGVDYFSRLARLVEYNATVPELVRLYAVLSVEAADPAHPAHAYFVDRYTNIRRDIRDAFEELHARGLVRPGMSIAGADADLMALIDGLQVQWLLLLLVGGHETTANMISLSVASLLDDPKLLAGLRERPERTPQLVEELLRFHSIVDNATSRVVVEDFELGGIAFRAGDGVIVAAAAASHDPDVFARPDQIDVDRGARHHLAFGFGIHQCLGQNLARLELEIVLNTLFARIPDLALADPVERLPFKSDALVYGIHRLPVTW
ncbi:cytochrome P450 [Nonomuraea sp. B10E15]|uniref:cytochrome P450 n=1 Tax=Nonomuraea sp. B10E15 TaxID=3153560 RepID=UPI00325CB7FE